MATPLLTDIPLFAGLAAHELQDLLTRVQRRTYRPDEGVFREGDPPTFIYYIVSGEVNLSLASEDRRISIGKFTAGHLLGILSLFDEDPLFLSAFAVTPTTILAIPRTDVVELVRRHPDMVFRLATILSRQVRAAALLVADMQFLDLPVRLAKRILELADQAGPARDGELLSVKITQEELSEMAGATRGGVNRALKRLETLGVVRTGRGRLTILDPDHLRALAQQDALPTLLGLKDLR